MNRLAVILIAVLVAAGMQRPSAQQGAAQVERLLASAQQKATIDGDLRGAIEEYKKALAAAGANRGLAAQALLRMAECHQKLGDAEAQAIYQRVVREYADQKDVVAVARGRLAPAPAATRAKADWSVWAGNEADGFGTISPDGRFLTYTDWSGGGHLALRDLAAGSNHRLTSGGSTQFSTISRDGKWVAYEWFDAKVPQAQRRADLRVARLQPTGITESRRLFENQEITLASPYDWSPDGKWIAVHVMRTDKTIQLGLVSVQDGSLRVLKSLDWKAPTKIFFSPDGKYIAYDLEVSDSSDDRHVFVMASDGSHEAAVAAHQSQNVIMGWSPDGRHVLFSSNRSGTFGLWAVAVDNGKPAGPPTLVKSDVSSSWSLGLTAAGTMYVWKYASPVYVQTSAVDLSTGRLASSPEGFQRFISSRGRPEWSVDGKHLAFQTCNPLGGGPCALWIRSMESGQLRELKPKLRYFPMTRWSPDGRELLTRATDLKGRNSGLYRIDAQTGDATLVVAGERGDLQPQWSADGKHILYRRGQALLERNLASGEDRDIVPLPAGNIRQTAISPDQRFLAFISVEPSDTYTLSVMPLAGGAPRAVLRLTAPDGLAGNLHWTANGTALAVAKQLGDNGPYELWLVPLEGTARKLDIPVANWMINDGFRFDRAGKQVAFVATAGQPGLEIRAIENFLPAPASGGRAAKK